MKPIFENIKAKLNGESFLAFSFEAERLGFNWHYHPEYELTLVYDTIGTRFLGDSIEDIEGTDLVLVGKNMPHTWTGHGREGQNCKAIVIQFSEAFIQSFLQWSEFEKVGQMIRACALGISFSASPQLIAQFERCSMAQSASRVGAFLVLLEMLSQTAYRSVSSAQYNPSINAQSEKRIQKVLSHIHANYRDKEAMQLKDVAEKVHLSPSAFSKFFKKNTGKTFSDYINVLRINATCALLVHSDEAIYTIAYQNGFDSLTYFNRVFLKLKGVTPKQYRRRV